MSTEYSRYFSALDDYNAGSPIDDRDIDGEFNAVMGSLNRKVLAKGTAPSGPTNGDTWIDTTNKQLKYYRVDEWVIIGVLHVGTSAPGTPQEGDVWYDTTNNVLKSYNGSSWASMDMSFPASTAQGDLLYLSAAKTLARLAKDTNESRYLSNQGGDNNPQWEKVDIASGVEIASEAQGDILYHDGSNWTRLPAGVSGYFLKTQGAGANPAWAAPNRQTYLNSDSPATFTVPAGVTLVWVTMCGGGGGGAGQNTGGGGGGAAIVNMPFVVTPAEEISIIIGAGGTGGTTGGSADGAAGGDSIWDNGGSREITCGGGGNGAVRTGGVVSGAGAIDATAADWGSPGFAGGDGSSDATEQNGGGCVLGRGGQGAASPSTPPGFGGGGGGDTDNGTQGASGAGGVCIIQW